MERLTYDFCVMNAHCWQIKGADNLECREVCENQDDLEGCKTCPIAKAFDRLAEIENILGDEYDLDRLRELVEADRDERQRNAEADADDIWKEDIDALEFALTALRSVSREQVEKVWRGEWIIGEPDGLGVPIHCNRCDWGSNHADQKKWMEYQGHIFCGHCGAPMSDEAVQMVMERLEAMKDGSTTD